MSVALASEHTLVHELTGLARAYEESQAFVSLLAHELRTRLKVTERALSSAGGVETALENTRMVQQLVDSLLDLARGGSAASADGAAAMFNVLDDLEAEIEARGARVVSSELPRVELPQGLLETVLRNLVANALEAGAARVEVFARGDGAICVRDDGPGVPPAEAARIFGVYSGKAGGAGLGLMLCREILRRRGGDVWLELPSTFCFRA
jgi:two-component system, OmpR family, sensor kinase